MQERPKLRSTSGSSATVAWIAFSIALVGFGVFLGLFIWAQINVPKTKLCGNFSINATDECYDVIIIGSGAAGATMARYVSQNGSSVLLLEAGDNNYNDQVIQDPDYGPALTFYFYVPQYLWPGQSVVQYQLPTLPSFLYTNGRLMGGGTAINTMLVVRGTSDYWNWVDQFAGGHGVWNSTSVFAAMKFEENYSTQGHFVADASRGTSGPWQNVLRPSNVSSDTVYFTPVLAAALNLSIINDYNVAGNNVGAFAYWDWQQRWLDGMLRETSAEAFLPPSYLSRTTYTGSNIKMNLEATVLRLLWDSVVNTTCRGVQYNRVNYGTMNAYARKAVIVATGINDVALLQQSGIGPAATLASANVTARVVNENVGRNFQNHIGVIYTFSAPNISGVDPDELPGALTTVGGAFSQDYSIYGTPGERQFQHIFLTFPGGFNYVPFMVTPLSTGTIDIQDPDPFKIPLSNPNYLSVPSEVQSHMAVIRKIVAGFNQTDPSIQLLSISPTVLNDDSLLSTYIESNVHFAHHWTAQVRLGANATVGAVDWRTRVFGTKGLRVCSASILPKVLDGNTATPTVALGKICADLLNADIYAGTV